MLLLAALSEVIGTSEDIGIVGVIIFMAGLFRLIYALVFEDGPYRRQLQRQQVYTQPAQLGTPREVSALPPQQSQAARAYTPPPRAYTAELAYRPSVTEGTTRLLEREPEERERR